MNDICLYCFKIKGQYEVCKFCGGIEGTPTNEPYYLQPGTMLMNHFLVGYAIGEGKSGIIYRCYDQNLGMTVAIKEYFPKGMMLRLDGSNEIKVKSTKDAAKYRASLHRFVKEARSIAKFGKAKDILNVYDFFEENQTAYLVMEYAEAKLLSEYIDVQDRLDQSEAVKIALSLCDAVKKVHSEGILHCDICAENIFVSNNYEVKIFDFGSAYFLQESNENSDVIPSRGGFSAPEVYATGQDVDYSTDVYSIGAVLYHMITGLVPPSAENRLREDALQAPSKLVEHIHPNLDRTIMEAMALDPKVRIPTVVELTQSLLDKRMAQYPEEKKRGIGLSKFFQGLKK